MAGALAPRHIHRRRLLTAGAAVLALPAVPVRAQRWNADALREADDKARELRSGAVLVWQRGEVVHRFGDVQRPVAMYSVRKSLLSLLIGIEVDAGRTNLDATLADLGIDDKEALTEAEKQATLRQLMQSRSGVYHPAAYETWDAARRRPARGSHAPGSHWYYNNWDFNALGTIYRRKTGLSVHEGFERHLAQPLGLQHWRPAEHAREQVERASEHAAYLFELSAEDLARVGQLLVGGGRWQGRTIIGQRWIDESTAAVSVVPPGWFGYALMWWLPRRAWGFWPRRDGEVFFASGNHGQMLVVDRARELVIVHNTDHRSLFRSSPDLGALAPLLERLFAAAPVG